MKSDLTISIVTYNSQEHILGCLESIYADGSGRYDVEVCVVDNNSIDNTVDLVRQTHPGTKLIVNPENLGFARANNQVLQAMNSRYGLITNPDVAFPTGALAKMIEFMDGHADAGALGCEVRSPDGSLQYSCRRYPSIVTFLIRSLLPEGLVANNRFVRDYLMKDVPHDHVMPVDWVTGCCLMVRQEALEEAGYMDERYFLYLEDTDLCRRINENWRVYYCPEASIVHEFGHRSRGLVSPRHTAYHVTSAVRFFRKYGWFPNSSKNRTGKDQ